ncbi:MAG TPA: hypothetical protein PKN50_09810 [Spirochaetota bacterium]|nr:hypothetical protein [Spirochaetota bacterium]HPV40972.1 hypothetical protein [Spirochaetota bacterium]
MKKTVLLLSALTASLLITSSAMAVGIGGYVDMGVGSTSGSGYGMGTDLIPTGGFILDTAAAKNKIFNYRFKFGGGRMFSGGVKFDKVGMVHTLGLSPVNLRGDEARFFFGPRIGIHYVGGEVKTGSTINPLMMLSPLGFLMSMSSSGSTTTRIDMVRFDLGLVLLGFNFNFGELATMTFEFGMNYGVMLGDNSGVFAVTGYEGFATIGFMFRINDTYNMTASTGDVRMQVKDIK